MKDYKVISDYSLGHLEESIKSYLEEGWQLVGGINIILFNENPDYPKKEEVDTLFYSQAVAK